MNPFHLIRRLYDWVLSWADKRTGLLHFAAAILNATSATATHSMHSECMVRMA
ncbi:MAG: hypothetical protein QGF79_04045 [Arenicellales bacterium]|nr:hypothetical protein [Arenicellales bacterium]MDP6550812.1 hypothetical protein [Arenicellales bacterium]MDP6917652.1 hypothetical protein [Arenicellales bacterium]